MILMILEKGKNGIKTHNVNLEVLGFIFTQVYFQNTWYYSYFPYHFDIVENTVVYLFCKNVKHITSSNIVLYNRI